MGVGVRRQKEVIGAPLTRAPFKEGARAWRPGEALRLSGAARGKKSRERKERRVKAAKAFKMDSDGAPTLGPGPLADRSLSKECLRVYVRRLGSFWAYVEAAELDISGAAEIDSALAKYCTLLWEAVDVVTECLLASGQQEAALFVQLGLSSYIRPSENHRLCLEDVIRPVPQASVSLPVYSLLIAPFEREVLTKTMGYDQAILLDDPRAVWLGDALELQCQRRKAQLRAQGLKAAEIQKQPLWSLGVVQMNKVFAEAVADCGLEWLIETSYQLRGSGASRDILMKLRSMEEVQRRGCWGHMSSIRHYEKHGRLGKLMHRIGQGRLAGGKAARASFRHRFRG
jgi:hypothetical protein